MQHNRYLFILLIQLVSPLFIFAQNIGIHAAPVGEWHSQEQFSPEYHYNSVAVYLLNEDKTVELFKPENLSKAQRKQTGIRNFDILESLYFSLQLPNPKQENEVIDFPLYAFDIHNSKSFQVPRNQGKIIDRITDEELNGKGLEAKAKIEAIKKNQLLEIAYQISSSVNKILGDKIFDNPGIAGVMRKAQSFFEDKYRGEIVSEFTVPILPGNEDFEYRLHSAAIYQVKWDFQPLVKTFKGNMWSDLQNQPMVTEEQLKDRPSRSSRFNKQPYLVVLRYKSAYSLPEAQKLNVEITQKYLEERLYNLQEFRKDGHQYQAEEGFLSVLREAIDLKRHCENYARTRDKGQADDELIMHIAQQHYELQNVYKKELKRIENNPAVAAYFKDNYEVTYYKFFKLIDNILFQDQQLKEIGQVPAHLATLHKTDLKRETPTNLYAYLKQLETYRRIANNVPQIEGDLFYKIREQINQIEVNFEPQVFNVPPIGDKQERMKKLTALKKQYPLCQNCQQAATKQINFIQQTIDDERRTALFTLKNQQLKYRKCFGDIQRKAIANLALRFPNKDSLSNLDAGLYTAYSQKIKQLETIAEQFQQIETVSIEKLGSEKLPSTLEAYEGILNQFNNETCQLLHGELLTKVDLECFGRDCRVIIP